MKKISGILMVLGTLFINPAQAQNWQWATAAGGPGFDYATGIVNDAAGNSYVSGSFDGTATFGDKRVQSAGNYDIYLAKLEPQGKVAWVIRAGGSQADEAYDLTIDPAGNLYVTGYFMGTADFGGQQLESVGDRDYFLAKYDTSGKLVWVEPGGGSGEEFGKAVATDGKGNIFVTGIYNQSSTFHKLTMKSRGQSDIFLADYGLDGSLKWIKSIGGSQKDEATALAADAAGNVYMTGFFSGAVDFGKTQLTSYGQDDIFVAKYDSKGNETWAVQDGGLRSTDRSYGIATDSRGNVYVTGSILGSARFDANDLKSVGAEDYFLAKYDVNGRLEWVQQSGVKNGEIGRAVEADANGNIYVCGDYNSLYNTAGKPSVGDWDVFVVRYDQRGNVTGTLEAGGGGYDRPFALSLDSQGNIDVTGIFEKTSHFGTNAVENKGKSDVFVAKAALRH
jgi:hypothetical protein